MTTRAAQIELLTGPLLDPTTGSLCSGYTVEFYSAGTSTAKNVWTEREKKSPFTTYTLDSGGKALLYGDGVYKIVIKNTDGAEVLSLDNQKIQATTFSVVQIVSTYTATPDDDVIICEGTVTLNLQNVNLFEHLLYIVPATGVTVTIDPYSSQKIDTHSTLNITKPIVLIPDVVSTVWRSDYTSVSSDDINYTASFTGAIPRDINTKLSDTVSVFDFGAVGDGVTDDTAAIQAAFSSEAGTILFPQTVSGNYIISSAVTLSARKEIIGQGQYHTRIACDDCDGIEIAAGITGVKISDIEIGHLVRYTDTANTHVGIKFLGTTGSRPQWDIVSNVFIDGFGTAIETNWLWATNFRNVHITYCHIGFYMKGLGCNCTISDCQINTDGSAGSRGLLLGDGTTASEGLMVTNSLIYYAEENIEAYGWGQSNIINCIIDFSRVRAINLHNTTTNLSVGWQISNNYIAVEGANGVAAIAIYNDLDHVQNLGNRITGNYILCYDGSTCPRGILIDGDYSDHNIVLGNSIKGFAAFDVDVQSGVDNIVAVNQCLSAAPSDANIYMVQGIAFGNVGTTQTLSATTSSGASAYRYGATTPAGSVTPIYVGEEYIDSTASPRKWYKATGLTSSDWVAIS